MHRKLLFLILISSFFVSSITAQGNQSLFTAVEKNEIEQVKKLLAEGANPNAIDDYGDAVLMNAALYASADCMKLLLDKGADPNFKNKEGATCLMFCAHDIEKTKLLLSQGADIHAKGKSGNTALHIAAVGNNNNELVKLLIDNGANPLAKNRLNESALIRATPLCNAELVKFLKEKGNALDSAAITGTALTMSLLYSNRDAALALLELGADPNAVDSFSIPLTDAVIFDDTTVILQLIKKTKDINALDVEGMSPLAWACYNEHDRVDIVQAMIDHGANVNIVYKNGTTPLSWALQKGNTKTVELLKKAGAKK